MAINTSMSPERLAELAADLGATYVSSELINDFMTPNGRAAELVHDVLTPLNTTVEHVNTFAQEYQTQFPAIDSEEASFNEFRANCPTLAAFMNECKVPDYSLIKIRDRNLDELNYNKPEPNFEGYVSSVLTDIFDPFLKKVLSRKYPIIKCSRKKFIRKFNIQSNILDKFDRILDEFNNNFMKENTVLFGGKVVDLIQSQDSGDNDFDLWVTNLEEDCGQFHIPESFVYVEHNHRFTNYLFDEQKIQVMTTLNNNGNSEGDVSIEDVLRSFDFRHCAVAIDRENFYWIKGALKDISLKRMVINKFNPSRTIGMRISKYANRGFTLSIPDMMLASIMQLSSVSFGSNQYEEQIFANRNYDASTLHEITSRFYNEII